MRPKIWDNDFCWKCPKSSMFNNYIYIHITYSRMKDFVIILICIWHAPDLHQLSRATQNITGIDVLLLISHQSSHKASHHKQKDHHFEQRCVFLNETITITLFKMVYLLSWKGYVFRKLHKVMSIFYFIGTRLHIVSRCYDLLFYYSIENQGQVQLTVKGSSNRTLPRFEEPILG